ncbi:type I DNA topoisomerase [Candidatus Saccharibacteria bacterium]|nr:type I DNA topoisomerase [Candidatus Saccharibacteria bacterium]
MSKNLVIVESPAKAKTIEKYLGSDFKVMSSVGHIRKDTKVDVDHDFAVTYEIDEDHKKIVKDLEKAAKSADTIWLATDEDREGESISWHLLEVLNLPKNTNRITFHEITKPALEDAVKHPRKVDMDMVMSQQARQTLDMLVGYDLSGVVRKKVPGAISAGRVQSPALRLIVEKEREIEKFDSKSSFKITGDFTGGHPQASFSGTLDGEGPATEAQAEKLLKSLLGAKCSVSSVEQTEALKPNPVPLATAALQIEANAKLGFSSSTTMRAAQGLYQAGHITYHRTDSLNLSSQALGNIANYIKNNYGENYLKVRHFKTKSAGAQEAHEAIRPTHIEKETAGSNDFERKLYQLIRSRTLATQMSNAVVNRTTVKLICEGGKPVFSADSLGRAAVSDSAEKTGDLSLRKKDTVTFIAKGEIIVFDGFLKVYGKSKELELPELKQGDTCNISQIVARQTFERPPARYTEGSLVKKLEELGIGRPSTYASIMNAIQARGYVKKGESDGKERKITEIIMDNESASGTSIEKRIVTEKTGSDKGKLIPTPVGELVADFLTDHFDQIVDYGFTADVETKLDKIAEKKLEKVKMLRDFYTPFAKLVKDSDDIARYNNANALGIDPKTGKNIYAKIGKNGGFIQLGENEKESGEKPRFAPLPKGATVKTVTLEQALKQLSLPVLPRSLGNAKDGTEIIAAAGPFGPYLKAGSYNIPMKGYDPYKITLKEAEPLYQAKIDSIIADWGEIMIISGAYGPYVKGPGRRNNAKIPKEIDPKKLTREEAEKILAEKPRSTSRHAPHKRKTAKKTTSKSKTKTKK